jgi:hypothetical protein
MSDAPFGDQRVGGKMQAKAFDVLAQCVPKFDDDRPDFVIVFCGENLLAQFANSVFHTTKHGAPASDDTAARD